jgi:hypothetical protein
MLMPDELHNWLLFMGLKAEKTRLRNSPSGPYNGQPQTWFSIPQAFPQAGRSKPVLLQT